MKYALVSETPAPIDLGVAKDWLEVTHNYHDTMIKAIIESAFSFAENYTGMSFREQSWALSASPVEAYNGITISKTPISDLTSVTVLGEDGQTKTLTEDDYYFTVESTTAFFIITDASILSSAKQKFNAVTVSFKTDGGLPPHIENAIKMLIAFMYENRGDAPTINNNSAPPEALKLLQIERVLFA